MGESSPNEQSRLVIKPKAKGMNVVYTDVDIRTRGDAARAASKLKEEIRGYVDDDEGQRIGVHEFLHAKTRGKSGSPRKMGYRIEGDRRGGIFDSAFVEFNPEEPAEDIYKSAAAPSKYPESAGELSDDDKELIKNIAPRGGGGRHRGLNSLWNREGSNLQPIVYKTIALPLSYGSSRVLGL